VLSYSTTVHANRYATGLTVIRAVKQAHQSDAHAGTSTFGMGVQIGRCTPPSLPGLSLNRNLPNNLSLSLSLSLTCILFTAVTVTSKMNARNTNQMTTDMADVKANLSPIIMRHASSSIGVLMEHVQYSVPSCLVYLSICLSAVDCIIELRNSPKTGRSALRARSDQTAISFCVV